MNSRSQGHNTRTFKNIFGQSRNIYDTSAAATPLNQTLSTYSGGDFSQNLAHLQSQLKSQQQMIYQNKFQYIQKIDGEPSSADYKVKGQFDKYQDQLDKFNKIRNHKINLRTIWDKRKETLKDQLVSKIQPPGPGQYIDNLKYSSLQRKGYSFSKDPRVFEKMTKQELQNLYQQKFKDYVSQTQDKISHPFNNTTTSISTLDNFYRDNKNQNFTYQSISGKDIRSVSQEGVNMPLISDANQDQQSLQQQQNQQSISRINQKNSSSISPVRTSITNHSNRSPNRNNAASYSFTQDKRLANIRQWDQNCVKAWPKCFYEGEK